MLFTLNTAGKISVYICIFLYTFSELCFIKLDLFFFIRSLFLIHITFNISNFHLTQLRKMQQFILKFNYFVSFVLYCIWNCIFIEDVLLKKSFNFESFRLQNYTNLKVIVFFLKYFGVCILKILLFFV